MTNRNDDRIVKRGSKIFSKQYVAKKRSREHGEEKNPKIFRLCLALAFILGITINLYSHPFMKIQDIYISGNTLVDDTEIIKKLKSPLGQNILLYNPFKYEDELIKLDYVKEVKIRKVFPKILSVKLVEEYPLFVKDGKTYITNRGRLVGNIDASFKDRLIPIKALSLNKEIGKNFSSSETIMDFINQISDSSFIADISQLNLENKLDIGIMVQDIEVKFGDLNNITYKIKLLESVLLDIKNKGLEVESINLNNGDNPLVVVDQNSFSENLNK